MNAVYICLIVCLGLPFGILTFPMLALVVFSCRPMLLSIIFAFGENLSYLPHFSRFACMRKLLPPYIKSATVPPGTLGRVRSIFWWSDVWNSVFLRDPQPVTRVSRLAFFEHFFGSYFLMTFWSPMIPQSVQVGLHVGSFLESCCLIFRFFQVSILDLNLASS